MPLTLLFYCGSDCFALDCEAVVELFPKVTLTKIPGQGEAAPYLVGLFNYGGKPVPVIDLCLLIEKRPCSDAMHSRLILVQTAQGPLLALLAEKVTETAEINRDRFIASGIQLEGLSFLGGVYNEGGRPIQRFDLDRFCQAIKAILVP